MCTRRINCARKPKTLFIIEFYWHSTLSTLFFFFFFSSETIKFVIFFYPFRLLVLLTWMNHSIRHSYTNWITCYGFKVFFIHFLGEYRSQYKKRIDLQWISKNKKTTFWLMMIIIIECTQIELLTYIWHRSICVL